MIRNFSKELVRRGVLRALGAYGVGIWLLAQGLVDLLPAVGFPDWAIQVFLAVSVSATPLVGIVAWRYDLTRKGFLRDKQDLIRGRAALSANAIDPATRATLQEDHGRSSIVVKWIGENGEACEKEFDTKFIIGRDFKAEVRLMDDCVSRQHVEVYPVDGQWCVRDLSSLNGTYVDNESIDKRKIERTVEVALDKEGPKVLLAMQVVDDTLMTGNTPEPGESQVT